MTSTAAEQNQYVGKENINASFCALRVGSFSGICVSGRTVLFCRFTRTHNRTLFSGRLKWLATRDLKILYVSCLSTRKLGRSEGGQCFSSKVARSKPSWCANVSSVMTLAVRNKCCSSLSLFFASIWRRSSSSLRSEPKSTHRLRTRK